MDLLLRIFQARVFKCSVAASSLLWNHAESSDCVCKFITKLFLALGFNVFIPEEKHCASTSTVHVTVFIRLQE